MRHETSQGKPLSSCIGIDDGPFLPRHLGGQKAPLVVVRLSGPHLVKARTGWVTVDGMDGTEQALRLLKPVYSADNPILMAGATFGGFNMIDPRRLQSRFKTPTLVVVGSRPDNRAVKRALVHHFSDWMERWALVRSLGPMHRVRTVKVENPIFYECFGCSSQEARRILSEWALVSRMPEPLRVAGLVARGLFSAQPAESA